MPAVSEHPLLIVGDGSFAGPMPGAAVGLSFVHLRSQLKKLASCDGNLLLPESFSLLFRDIWAPFLKVYKRCHYQPGTQHAATESHSPLAPFICYPVG